MGKQYPYQEEWTDYRIRAVLPWLLFPLWLVFILIFSLLGKYFTGLGDLLGFHPFFVLFAIVGLYGLGTTVYATVWKCPACKNYFGIRDGFDLIMKKPYRAKRCKHCGLPKYFGSTSWKILLGLGKLPRLPPNGRVKDLMADITVLFFGQTAEIVGCRNLAISSSDRATVRSVYDELAGKHKELGGKRLLFSLNEQYATGDEISGTAMNLPYSQRFPEDSSFSEG